jgi:hypothetical protein
VAAACSRTRGLQLYFSNHYACTRILLAALAFHLRMLHPIAAHARARSPPFARSRVAPR